MHTAWISRILGVRSVVFHPAYYHEHSPELVLKRTARELLKVREELEAEGNEVILRPETTGKPSQLGTLQETLLLAQVVPGVLPCIDFSHLHARSNGRLNTYDEFCKVLEASAEALGERWVKNAHFHISGIDYGLKGEKKHRLLKESDLKYQDLMRALNSFGVEGLVICESLNLEEDALLLQSTFRAL